MKLKTVLRLTFAISLSAADAVGLTIIDHTAQLRKRLEIRRSDGAFPIGNDYNALVQAVWETKGLPRSAVHTAILAEAEESNAQLKFGAPRWDQGGRNWSCINMLTFMRQSGDRGFLPCIEKLGMESACWSVREAALQTHVAMCGFDSFPFVKRAVEAAEVFPVSESVRSVRGRMVETFLGLSPLSEEQITEVCRWLLELTGISDDALLLRMCDRFLRTHLPEYAYSRQRFLLASREDLSPVDPLGQCREHFAAVKAEIEAVPPSKRTDLRIRYPNLPPLPDDPAEAEASVPRAWLIAAVGVAALLAAALALLRRAKKAGAA